VVVVVVVVVVGFAGMHKGKPQHNYNKQSLVASGGDKFLELYRASFSLVCLVALEFVHCFIPLLLAATSVCHTHTHTLLVGRTTFALLAMRRSPKANRYLHPGLLADHLARTAGWSTTPAVVLRCLW
jgi:hypothetical protein